MTRFITANQIVEYEAESERPTSKKETSTNGKRTKYFLFFGNRNTLNSKTKNPHLRWKGLLQSTKVGQLIWSVRLFCLLHCRAFGIKRLSPRGESLVEVYIFSAFQWESLLYRVLKWWRHENEISEIMRFVRIFWKTNVQEAYLPKMSISGQIVSQIVAQLYSENSIQTLPIFFSLDPKKI